MDVYSLQQLMGHSDITVLRRYLKQAQDDLREAHHKAGVIAVCADMSETTPLIWFLTYQYDLLEPTHRKPLPPTPNRTESTQCRHSWAPKRFAHKWLLG